MRFPTAIEVTGQKVHWRHWTPSRTSSVRDVADVDWGHGQMTACGMSSVGMVTDWAPIEDVNCLVCQTELAAFILRADDAAVLGSNE